MKKFLFTISLFGFFASCQKEAYKTDTSINQQVEDEAQLTGGRPFEVMLTGEAERPGPGDPDGSGTARITLNQGQGTIRFDITVANITLPAVGAHIHVGGSHEPGPVVVPLTPPDASGHSSGEVSVDPELIKAIRQNPENYYINVHSLPLYAAGAVRGQLSK